jgi:hypothetical protein
MRVEVRCSKVVDSPSGRWPLETSSLIASKLAVSGHVSHALLSQVECALHAAAFKLNL